MCVKNNYEFHVHTDWNSGWSTSFASFMPLDYFSIEVIRENSLSVGFSKFRFEIDTPHTIEHIVNPQSPSNSHLPPRLIRF